MCINQLLAYPASFRKFRSPSLRSRLAVRHTLTAHQGYSTHKQGQPSSSSSSASASEITDHTRFPTKYGSQIIYINSCALYCSVCCCRYIFYSWLAWCFCCSLRDLKFYVIALLVVSWILVGVARASLPTRRLPFLVPLFVSLDFVSVFVFVWFLARHFFRHREIRLAVVNVSGTGSQVSSASSPARDGESSRGFGAHATWHISMEGSSRQIRK